LNFFKRNLNSKIFLFFLIWIQNYTFANVDLKLESWGYLREAQSRVNSANVLTLAPVFYGQGQYTEGEFGAQISTFLHDATTLTIESKNTYLATSKKLFSNNQFTLGRRIYDFSEIDENWQYGLWSPRFMFDPLRRQNIGLTGAFYTHESSVWRILAYASPVAIPERGFPVQNVNGEMSSPSPSFVPLPSQLNLMSSNVPIYYNLHMPSYSKILFRPSAALQLKYGQKQGIWAKAGYGYMPVHQYDVALSAALSLPNNRMNVDLYPRFPMHHLVTIESGYKHKIWNGWVSVNGERPDALDTPKDYIANVTGSSLITALGSDLIWNEGLKLSGSYLFVLEQNKGVQGPSTAGDLNIELPSRFMYRRALFISAGWDHGSPSTYKFQWTYDLPNQTSLFSGNYQFSPKREKWSLLFGFDMIAASTNKGFIGQYNGDDRVRAGINYAF
jgi:hypothetical protein